MISELGPQRPDIDPRAGRELEILCDAAVEQQAFPRIVGIGEFESIAEAIVALLVEGLRRQVRLSPITRHDARAAHACFELAIHRRKLKLEARCWQADVVRPVAGPRTYQSERRGFRGSEAREHQDLMTDGLKSKFLELVEHMLSQARTGVKHDIEVAKEGLAQRPVATQVR